MDAQIRIQKMKIAPTAGSSKPWCKKVLGQVFEKLAYDF